jgi:hypothetical protein
MRFRRHGQKPLPKNFEPIPLFNWASVEVFHGGQYYYDHRWWRKEDKYWAGLDDSGSRWEEMAPGEMGRCLEQARIRYEIFMAGGQSWLR